MGETRGRKHVIDLHLHSYLSRDSNERDIAQRLIDFQLNNSRQYLIEAALTDHNCIKGNIPFLKKIAEANNTYLDLFPITAYPGCELSLSYDYHKNGNPERKHLHFLVYFIPTPEERTNIETYINTLDEGPFGAILHKVNDTKRERMDRFIHKWVQEGLLKRLRSGTVIEEITPTAIPTLIELIDDHVGTHAPLGTNTKPAYMRSDIFHILEELGYTQNVRDIRTMMHKGHPERHRVHVSQNEVSHDISVEEGLQLLRAIPQRNIVALAHPWEYEFFGKDSVFSKEHLEHYIATLSHTQLIQGLQTDGYREYEKDPETGRTEPQKEEKIYMRIPTMESQQFKAIAKNYGIDIVIGSDYHGTEKKGIDVGKDLFCDPLKWEERRTITKGEKEPLVRAHEA